MGITTVKVPAGIVDTRLVPICEDEFTKVAIRFMRVNKGRRNKDHGCVASHPTIYVNTIIVLLISC